MIATAQAPPGTEPAPIITLPPVEVIATSPLPGVGIDRDKVPGTARSLSADDFARTASPYITETLFQRIPDISLSDPNGNNAVQELSYRGFAASPLQGTPQGLAVYMSGIRLNEAFGDTVNWDLIPTNAISRADVWTNNPVFGLNALGGAVSLQMKNGFNYEGFEGEIQGGSFGRRGAAAEYGGRFGDYAVYFAGQGIHDDGWRFRSPTDLARLFGDLGWRDDHTELHLITLAATSSMGAAAATPIQRLDRDIRAVYTTPQSTDNQAVLLGLNGKSALTSTWSLQGSAYVRGFRQHHIDGNFADSERCSNSASPQFRSHLCLADEGFPRPSPVTTAFRDQFALLDQHNNTIPCPPGSGNTCDTTPFGTLDRTATRTTTVGASLQASASDGRPPTSGRAASGAGDVVVVWAIAPRLARCAWSGRWSRLVRSPSQHPPRWRGKGARRRSPIPSFPAMARSFIHWGISDTGRAASRHTTAITGSTHSILST